MSFKTHGQRDDLTTVWRSIDGSQLSDGHTARRRRGKGPTAKRSRPSCSTMDSIVDVCSVAICLDDLGIEDIVVESLSEGHGTIRCAHGLMPIPVPAVVNLCQAGTFASRPHLWRGIVVRCARPSTCRARSRSRRRARTLFADCLRKEKPSALSRAKRLRQITVGDGRRPRNIIVRVSAAPTPTILRL